MMLLLTTYIWTALLISIFQVLLLAWLFWPKLCSGIHRVRRLLWQKVHCPWCWKAWHVRMLMPPQWSSCMCVYHYHVEMYHLAARRSARTTVALPRQEKVFI